MEEIKINKIKKLENLLNDLVTHKTNLKNLDLATWIDIDDIDGETLGNVLQKLKQVNLGVTQISSQQAKGVYRIPARQQSNLTHLKVLSIDFTTVHSDHLLTVITKVF